MITPKNILGGFRKAGVYPFDPTHVSALKESGLNGGKSNSTDTGDSLIFLVEKILLTVTLIKVLIRKRKEFLEMISVAHPQVKMIFIRKDLRRDMTFVHLMAGKKSPRHCTDTC